MSKKMHWRISTALFVLSFAAVAVLAAAVIWSFTARSSDEGVVLEWRTGNEASLDHFDLLRDDGASGNFVIINPEPILPKGNNSLYTYIDRSVFKPTDRFYRYRLLIVNKGSPPDTMEANVLHSVSSVKRTWGSIKAMFR